MIRAAFGLLAALVAAFSYPARPQAQTYPGFPNNVINLASQYNVIADGSTDQTSKIAAAIAAANTAGGNVVLQFPAGTTVATSLSATISTPQVWLVCNGAPGSCILKGGANNVLTWTGNYGGAYNMGFDNSGTATNNTISVNAFGTEFHHIFLNSGIGTFLTMSGTNANLVTADDIFGTVSCTPAVPLFAYNQGNGLTIRNSNVSGNCAAGSPVTGRYFASMGNGTANLDSLIIQNNFIQIFDSPLVVLATNSKSNIDIFVSGNVWDQMNSGFLINAASGGQISSINLDDPWLGVYFNKATTAGTCILFQGAGTINGVHVSEKMGICGGSGILGNVSGTASFWTFENVLLEGGNSLNIGGTIGIVLNNGVGTWSNIAVKNSRFGAGINSANPLSIGCQFNGVVDHMLFIGNDCAGTTPYFGMISGTGTTFAHTNSKQSGNVNLIDDDGSWTAYTPTLSCGVGTLTSSSASGRYKKTQRIVAISLIINITTVGTCSGTVNATLPFTANTVSVLSGRENLVTGNMLQGSIAASATTANVLNYNNTSAAASGAQFNLGGVYESVQ